MSVPTTSIQLASFVVNTINLKEQLQDVSVTAENKMVDARGIADRYAFRQVTGQKQSIEFMAHWENNGNGLEATPLDITVWSVGGVNLYQQLKGGDLSIVNAGPNVKAITAAYDFPVPTSTDCSLTTDLLVLPAGAIFTPSIMNDTIVQFALNLQITFAGETIQWPGVLEMSKHGVRRGEAQLENAKIGLQGTPSTPGDSGSLIYAAVAGTAVTTADVNFGTGEYKNNPGQTYMISRLAMRFAEEQLIQQNITLEAQGGMSAVA